MCPVTVNLSVLNKYRGAGRNLPVRPVYENDWLDLEAANMVAETDIELLLAQMTAAARKR
jgi:hypothetical protein